MLGVWWKQETALEMKVLKMEQIGAVLVQEFGMDENDRSRVVRAGGATPRRSDCCDFRWPVGPFRPIARGT